jgi:hypothetical protein
MRRFRFHLGTLVLVVLVIGTDLAALRESNEIWDSGVFTLIAGALLTSVLLAIHRTESKRAFWLGFALFGTAYLVLSLVASIEPRLVTTKALAYIDSKLLRSSPAGLSYFEYDDDDGTMDLFVANNSQPSALDVNKGNGTFQDVSATVGLDYTGKGKIVLNNSPGLGLGGTSESFERIGHWLFALIVGFLGGLFSQYLHPKNLGRTSALSCPKREHAPAEHLTGQGSTS